MNTVDAAPRGRESNDSIGGRQTILFLNLVGIIGGQEVVLLDIVRHLDPRQYRCVVVCLFPGALTDALNDLGVRTYVLPPHRIRQPVRLARTLRGLARIVADERADLVHCNGDTLLFYGFLAATLRWQVPCVWHVYEPVATTGSPFVRFLYQMQRRMRAAWTIFGTAAVEESYVRHYPRLGPRTAIMPGVDVDAIGRNADPHAARRGLGIPADAPLLLTIGRVQRSKGHRELIEAMARLSGRFDPPHLVLCGGRAFMTDEDFHDELTSLIARHDLAHRVHFTGYVSDQEKRNLLAAATVLVHPAHFEAFGIAVIEGMAAGKPVVVTDAVGPVSIVRGSGAGDIVKAKDTDALVDAIRNRLEKPEESRRMGAMGREHVRARYDTARMVGEVERVYRAVLGEVRTKARPLTRSKSAWHSSMDERR